MDPLLRRIGWAYAALSLGDSEPLGAKEPAFVRFGGLPGRQTVNRGEIWAFKNFLADTAGAAITHYVFDSSYGVKGVNKLLSAKFPRSNRDIWKEIGGLLRNRRVHIYKIESHLQYSEALAKGVPIWQFTSNAYADAVADVSAESVQIEQGQATIISDIRRMARQIRARAAAALINASDTDPRAPKQRPAPAKKKIKPLKALEAKSSHSVARAGGRWICTACHDSCPRVGLRDWLISTCIPVAQGPKASRPSSGKSVQIGGGLIHPTHPAEFSSTLGVWYCTACGATGAELLKHLAAKCPGTMTKAGRQNIARIERGLYPGSSAKAKAYNHQLQAWRARGPRRRNSKLQNRVDHTSKGEIPAKFESVGSDSRTASG